MSVRRRKVPDPKTGKLKDVWMIDFLVEDKEGHVERIRRFAPIQNKRAAEQYERELRHKLTHRKKEDIPIECPKFREFSVKFMEVYASTNNKPSEVQNKRSVLKIHLMPIMANLRLDKIDSRMIEEYKSKKTKDNYSKKTINNHLIVLRKMLATAVEWRSLAAVPKFRWLKAPRPEFFFLTFEEAAKLIEAAQPEWRCMIIVGLRAGLRLGELRALRWTDVDLNAGRLVVKQAASRGIIGTPKNGRWREIPLGSFVSEALDSHKHHGEFVFGSPKGRIRTTAECRRPIWYACEQAGLRRFGWHVLRHTFASHLSMKGVPLSAIKELLGHATIEMTMRYAHLEPIVGRNAVRLLDCYGTYKAHGGDDMHKTL